MNRKGRGARANGRGSQKALGCPPLTLTPTISAQADESQDPPGEPWVGRNARRLWGLRAGGGSRLWGEAVAKPNLCLKLYRQWQSDLGRTGRTMCA